MDQLFLGRRLRRISPGRKSRHVGQCQRLRQTNRDQRSIIEMVW